MVRFRLTVTCSDGQRRTAFQSVYIFGNCGGPGPVPIEPCISQDQQQRSSDQPEINLQADANAAVLMYPNPSANEVKLTFNGQEGNNITVQAYSMLSGKSYKLYKGKYSADSNELLLNVSRLDQGMYQLIITLDGSEVGVKRLLIQR